MSDESRPGGGVPTAPNPNRAPTAELTDSISLFKNKGQLLGDVHRFEDGSSVPCGAACPYRVHSITCPFFKSPCLVGCEVKQKLAGEGMNYEEIQFFVVAQSGPWLIGEETVVNMSNLRSSYLRIVRDKKGRHVMSGAGLEGSFLDEPGANMTLFEEVEIDDGTPVNFGFGGNAGADRDDDGRSIAHAGEPGEAVGPGYDLRDPKTWDEAPGAAEDDAGSGAGAQEGAARAGDATGGDGRDAGETREGVPAGGDEGANAEGGAPPDQPPGLGGDPAAPGA